MYSQKWTWMETFYNDLNAQARKIVDASTNGSLFDNNYIEVVGILERIFINDFEYPTAKLGTNIKIEGKFLLDELISIQVEISDLTSMERNLQKNKEIQEVKAVDPFYTICGKDHYANDCPANPDSVNFIGNFNQNNLNSNTYNAG
ncbi:hypothetical protein GQ457_02G042700 [Hibiscus cannabinus]